MADIKLKPCPFCGCEAEIGWEIDTGYYYTAEKYSVCCVKCGCDLGGIFGFKTEEEAAEAWNKRADVRPERYGEWKHVAGMNSKCSECGHYFPVTEFEKRPFDINYCPNCGAKMDGGEESG